MAPRETQSSYKVKPSSGDDERRAGLKNTEEVLWFTSWMAEVFEGEKLKLGG